MNASLRTWVWVVSLLLVGCSAKPPGCADPETLKTMRSLVVEDTTKVLAKQAADDPEQWVAKFTDALTVELSGIVSDGYKEDAKKQFCRATMKLQAIDGAKMEVPVVYSTQRTEDQKGAFLMEVQDFAPIVSATGAAGRKFYEESRWTGSWTGTYACGGLGGATDGPQGPFSMPVTMTVEGTSAKLERTTVGGGIEQLEGRFDTMGFDEPFLLQGTGQNSPDDTWRTRFVGKASGLQLTADGFIRVAAPTGAAGADGGPPAVRKCRLELALQPKQR
jgi:hypothetical protein